MSGAERRIQHELPAAPRGDPAPAAGIALQLQALMVQTQAILRELAELRAEVAALRPISRGEPTTVDVKLVGAIYVAVGDREFVAREILEYVEDPRLQGSPELLTALRAALPTAQTSRALGKRLKALQGKRLGSLQVDRLGEDREGALWQLRECGF